MRSASTARQPVSASSASSAPMSQEAPTTPPAPRTRPTRMTQHRTRLDGPSSGGFRSQERVRKGPLSRQEHGASAASAARGLRNPPPNVGCMTAQGRAGPHETPRMRLVFEGIGADEPIRPVAGRRRAVGPRGDLPGHAPARRAPARSPPARVGAGTTTPRRCTSGSPDCGSSRRSRSCSRCPWHVYTRPVLRLRLRRRPRLRRARAPPRRCSTARARTSGAAASRASSPKRGVDGVAGVAGVQARGGGAHRAVPPAPRSTSR